MAKKQLEVARFLHQYNISLFGLLETKVKHPNLGQLYQRMCPGWGFSHNLAWSDKGRIIIWWKHEHMSVNIGLCSSQLMHLEVFPTMGSQFSCTFVYGSSLKHERDDLFQQLECLANQCRGPWLFLGDLNCIANFNERIGKPVKFSDIIPLRSCLDKCKIHDMKSSGHFYTWNNKQDGGKRVFSKIDRALCNDQCDDMFDNAEASFLPEGCFDHSPILIQFYKQVRVSKPFKFCNYWATNDLFLEVVENVWKCQIQGCVSFQIQQKLRNLKPQLKKYFLRTPLQASLCKIESEYSEVQERLHLDPTNQHLISLEFSLAQQLKKTKSDYASFIQQQAKVNWLKYGDENSSVFHNSLKQRRACNRINMIISDGNIVSDPA